MMGFPQSGVAGDVPGGEEALPKESSLRSTVTPAIFPLSLHLIGSNQTAEQSN